MKRFAASLVAAAALLGSTLAGTALGQDPNAQAVPAAPEAFHSEQGWNDGPNQDRNDQARYRDDSDWDRNGSNWGPPRGRFNILDGRWVANTRAANYGFGRGNYRGGPMREVLLPNVINIDQKPRMVRIADKKNNALQLIMLGGKFNSRNRGQADYVVGRWHGSTLVVEHSTGQGATITQTFALENRGRTLVVKTRRDGYGRRAIEVTNTYYRA